MESDLSRRKFLQSTAAIVAGSVVGINSMGAFASIAQPVLSFDLHCHPGLFFAKGVEGYNVEAGVNKTLSEMVSGNLSGAFFSLVADARTIKVGPEGVKPFRNFAAGEAWVDYKRQIQALKEIVKENNSFALGTTGRDLKKNFNSKKISGYVSIEGADFLEGDAGKLDQMYEDGVRSVQLVHYHPNEIGDLQTETPQHNGLSAVGKEVVKRMNKLRMIIDVAHATFETTKAVADASTQPIILSHSILTNDSVHPLGRRTISPEHAKIVAQTGGVIGAWPSGLNKSFDDFLDNTLRLIDTVGIDHVGLGTDMDANFKPVFSSYTQMPRWIEGLQAKGLKDNEVRKVVGGNVSRVLEKILS